MDELYCIEAKWILGNKFRRLKVNIINYVFHKRSGENFTRAFKSLAGDYEDYERRDRTEQRRKHMLGLPHDEFPDVFPWYPFIKKDRAIKRFVIRSVWLVNEIDSIPELKLGVDQQICTRELRFSIDRIMTIAENAREMHQDSNCGIDHLVGNNITDFFTAMLDTRKEFINKGIPGNIDIGFHWTHSANVRSILRNGILSKADRELEKVVSSKYHGDVFGNGVYTGDDPKSFSYYGDTCVMVARLTGSVARVPVFLPQNSNINANTIIGNKCTHPLILDDEGWPVRRDAHETVLTNSSQCLGLIKFDESLVNSTEGLETIGFMKRSLQKMIDKHCDGEMTKPITLPLINPFQSGSSWSQSIQKHELTYNAPKSLDSGGLPTSGSVTFQQALKEKPQCPMCKLNVGKLQGKSPSGRMIVMIDPRSCSGFNCTTIVSTYDIPAGAQSGYHEHPGQPHGGKFTSAYLPNNSEGQNILKRLKHAFLHGLTFTVGTSLTTGKANQCTWASVPHKTSMRGGVKKHGFPDPNYIRDVNNELNALGVPSADAIDADGIALKPKQEQKYRVPNQVESEPAKPAGSVRQVSNPSKSGATPQLHIVSAPSQKSNQASQQTVKPAKPTIPSSAAPRAFPSMLPTNLPVPTKKSTVKTTKTLTPTSASPSIIAANNTSRKQKLGALSKNTATSNPPNASLQKHDPPAFTATGANIKVAQQIPNVVTILSKPKSPQPNQSIHRPQQVQAIVQGQQTETSFFTSLSGPLLSIGTSQSPMKKRHKKSNGCHAFSGRAGNAPLKYYKHTVRKPLGQIQANAVLPTKRLNDSALEPKKTHKALKPTSTPPNTFATNTAPQKLNLAAISKNTAAFKPPNASLQKPHPQTTTAIKFAQQRHHVDTVFPKPKSSLPNHSIHCPQQAQAVVQGQQQIQANSKFPTKQHNDSVLKPKSTQRRIGTGGGNLGAGALYSKDRYGNRVASKPSKPSTTATVARATSPQRKLTTKMKNDATITGAVQTNNAPSLNSHDAGNAVKLGSDKISTCKSPKADRANQVSHQSKMNHISERNEKEAGVDSATVFPRTTTFAIDCLAVLPLAVIFYLLSRW